MRQIIKGLIYDTNTATIVAQGDNGLFINDHWYRAEELYRTPRGNYFVYDQSSNIRPVDVDAKSFGREDYEQTINEWLNEWGVQSLGEREVTLFDIKCS